MRKLGKQEGQPSSSPSLTLNSLAQPSERSEQTALMLQKAIAPNAFGLNEQIYQRLKAALSLKLRRQIFLAVCDDLTLRNRLAAQLHAELAHPPASSDALKSAAYPRFVTLSLNLNDPNLAAQIVEWIAQNPPPETLGQPAAIPGFQILGIERLTRRSPALQRLFLNYLQRMARSSSVLDSSLILWLPRPWFLSIRQSAPEFWRCHTGIFEFVGEPTALPNETDDDAPLQLPILEAQTPEIPQKQEPSEEAKPAPSPVTVKESSTSSLAERYRTLGNSYRDRIAKGEATPQNLRLAIQAYEQALEHLDATSTLWADLLNDLGNLYWMLARSPDNAEQALSHLEQAINTYQLALSQTHLSLEPQAYARIQNNLGAAFGDLARYREPADNLQQSIQAYTQALRYRLGEQNQDLKYYASTQNNLGTAYWNLAQHREPAANLKRAIAAYQEALQYYTPEREALSYAMIQNNLGTAYWNLAQYEKPQDYLQMAIWAYQVALKYRTASVAPTACAATQNNLGTAYWHLANLANTPTEKRAELLLQCIATYELALKTASEIERPTLSFDLFATHNNLGLAHYQLATDSKIKLASEPASNGQLSCPLKTSQHLESALAHHVRALEGWIDQAELYQNALTYIVQTIRAFYNECGFPGQNLALSKVPPTLLPEILRRL